MSCVRFLHRKVGDGSNIGSTRNRRFTESILILIQVETVRVWVHIIARSCYVLLVQHKTPQYSIPVSIVAALSIGANSTYCTVRFRYNLE